MKKIMIFAVLATAALAAFSCTQVEQDVVTTDGSLVLSVNGGEMATRADGDEPNFETVIDHFDFFFFKNAEGTEVFEGMHGRASGSSTTLDTQEGHTYAALRSTPSYVYILANYPGEIDHTRDWTLAEILALDVNSPIVTEKKTALNTVTNKQEETGEVTFTENLVMDSWQGADVYTTELVPAQIQERRSVDIELARLATKIKAKITIVPSVTVGTFEWKPRPELLKVYYVNALNNKTTVAGTPVKRSEIDPADLAEYEYLTYPKPYPMTPAPEEGTLQYETDPFYTYPQTWASDENGEPYIKIEMPWMNERNDDVPSLGSSNFYYKVTVPKPDTEGNWTLDRNVCYVVNLTLSMVNPQDDYVQVDYGIDIVPWAESGRPGGSGLSAARFFSVPNKVFTMYSQENLPIPFSSSSAVSAYFTEISYSYYGASDGTVAEYVFRYTEADNVSSLTLPATDSNGHTVVEKAKESNVYSLASSGKSIVFSHSMNGVYTQRTIKFVLKNSDGRSAEVTVTQHPAIEIKTHETKNGFVNGWFARATADVKDGDGNLMGEGPYTTTHFGGGQFYHSTSYWYTNSAGPRVGNDASTLNNLGILYGDCTTSVSANCLFDTEVSVSAFDEEEGNNSYTITYSGAGAGEYTKYYRIGDPRVKASVRFGNDFTLPHYLYSDRTHRDPVTGETTVSETSTFRDWESPLEILMASKDASVNEVIAPRFLVSSNFNNMSNWPLGNDNCARRAATYQENGYPAGRWRLPTEAEINFMMTLQQKGIIPQLYAFGSSYQCANGRAITIAQNGTRTSVDPKNAYIRFVYDLWYWGDEKMDPNVYHANAHLVKPNPDPTVEP